MKKQIIQIITACVLFIIALCAKFENIWISRIIYIISYLIVGGEIIIRAIKNIFKGKLFDEHFLMAVATIGAIAIGEYPEAVAVMLFYQVGELFQDYAVDKSKRSISELMDIRPDYANVERNGNVIKVKPEEVKINEIIVVKPGEKVPLDGTVIDGNSMIDTSSLTGESVPQSVKKNDRILSGSINQNGTLKIKVEKKFGESTVHKILDLVENASNKKSKSENFITKFAKYYTPIVVILAVMLGGASGVLTFSVLGAGLVAAASPGSIIAILAMTAKGKYFAVIAGVVVATVVSFLVSSVFVKRAAARDEEQDLDAAQAQMKNMKAEAKNQKVEVGQDDVAVAIDKEVAVSDIKKIIFACDAGMGSSAMGAARFKSRIKDLNLGIEVAAAPVDNVPADAQIIVTHESLAQRAEDKYDDKEIIEIKNFLKDDNIEALYNRLAN